MEQKIITDELIEAVKQWARNRNINNPEKQFIKVVEEVAELGREIVRGRYDSDEVRDAIGDSLVTIIVLSDILGFDPIIELQGAYDQIKEREGITVDGCFVKQHDIAQKN